MRLDEAVDRYMTSRKTSGYAANTLRNNTNHLNALIRTLPRGVEVHRITMDMMEQAWTELWKGRSNITMIQSLSTYNMFFRWCTARGITKANFINPCTDIRAPKEEKRERFRVPVTQFPQLLDAADNPRDRGVIAVALYLMLRQSEIASLTVADVNLEDGEITTRIHKSNVADRMPIPRELDTELRRWLTYYTQEVGPLADSYYLFPARRPTQFNHNEQGHLSPTFVLAPHRKTQRMERIAQAAIQRCGYEMDIMEGIHTLRRSAARALFDRLVEDGYDGAIRMVQAMLHHTQISTTERYIGLSLDRKRRDDLIRGKEMYPTEYATELRAVQ